MIPSIYKPVQPGIRFASSKVTYEELPPSDALKPFIHFYWQLKTTETLEESFDYRVVSDGCIDIFFEAKNPSSSFIMGFCKNYTVFPIGNEFNYIGISFYPSMLPKYFGIDAKKLSNVSTPLAEMIPEIFQFLSELNTEDFSLNHFKGELNTFFLKQFNKSETEDDIRFSKALKYIIDKHGKLETESDLDIGLSPRQLRRLFNYYIGTSPKNFAQVIRFQKMLSIKPSNAFLKSNKIYYDHGYYDQSHFIKEFKKFYGVTPKEAFN